MSAEETGETKVEETTLAGGCFWCLEAAFLELEGILSAQSGYTGGDAPDPTYEWVCSGNSGHAEVVQLGFNPDVISFDDVLEVFFAIHDPTTLDRQGGDIGSQYRSEIFYQSPEQKAASAGFIEKLGTEKIWPDPIVTRISPLDVFYEAEEYHQNYFEQNPGQGYCLAVVAPKVAKVRLKFASRLKNR